MRIHHLNCGTMRPLGGGLIDGQRGVFRRAEMICHCLLIDTGSNLVLVETGIGSPSVERPDEWLGRRFVQLTGVRTSYEETAVAQVQRLGYAVGDVRHIILTHLDLDHAGGLVDFPRATVHVYAEELRALRTHLNDGRGRPYRSVQFEHGPRWSPYAGFGERWYGFDAVRELKGLPPEILLIPLAGHTRGHAGVAIDTGDGWLLHAGDSYFFPGEMTPRHPHCPPGLALFEVMAQTERRSRLENQHRLRELVRDHGSEVTIFSAHSAVELRQMVPPLPYPA